MNWMSADLCGRDVRKIFAPKTVEYKRPRGRPLKYRGYDFDDCEEAQADAYGPDHIQTSWAQIGDGTRQVHAKNADVAVIFTEWATEAWLHGEGGSVRADSTEELVKEWLAVNTSAKCQRFKRTRPWPGRAAASLVSEESARRQIRKSHRMTQIVITVPNEVRDYLEHRANVHGLTLETLLRKSVSAYVSLALGAEQNEKQRRRIQ